MNESEIRVTVSEIVASVLTIPSEKVSARAHFYDELGGDSLQKLEVIARLEAQFSCRLTDEEAAASDTVEQLALQVAQYVS
jgi:acyl carrier protein